MTFRIRIPDTGENFPGGERETVLEAALRAGVTLPCDCRTGACGTCRVRILDGAVKYDDEPMGLSPDEASAGFALACCARPASDLAIRFASPVTQSSERHFAKLRTKRNVTPDIVHVTLDAPPIDFLPGQYMRVLLKDGGSRSFSMASVPTDGQLDFHVRRIPGGRFTDLSLGALAAGDGLQIELPLGAFFFRRQDCRPVVMAATGTGIAPIRCILESLLDDPDHPPITLYWGMRDVNELYLDETFRNWTDRRVGLTYVPVLSRADSSWDGRRGYVQHAIEEDFSNLSQHAIYLCGSPNMINDARKSVVHLGACTDYIYTDSFTFQKEEELT